MKKRSHAIKIFICKNRNEKKAMEIGEKNKYSIEENQKALKNYSKKQLHMIITKKKNEKENTQRNCSQFLD